MGVGLFERGLFEIGGLIDHVLKYLNIFHYNISIVFV